LLVLIVDTIMSVTRSSYENYIEHSSEGKCKPVKNLKSSSGMEEESIIGSNRCSEFESITSLSDGDSIH